MKAPYGHCPICGAPGIARERSIGGKDRCSNGHDYPSLTSVLPPEQQVCVRPKGSTSAPILTRTIRDLGPDGSDVPLSRTVRWQADVTDPDDQRAIWRLAAIERGALEEDAARAFLVRSPTSAGSQQWTLRTGFGLSEWWVKVEGVDITHATAALCLAIWGPQ